MPEGEHVVPLGKARLAREGDDVTLVAYGSMVPLCEQAADELDDVSVEVLDIRTLKPLDEDALLASAAKTGRVVIVQEAPRVCGFAAELAAILAEKAILDLRGPVLRVTGYDVPYPYWQIEDAYMPSVERVDSRPSASCSSSERRLPALARAHRDGYRLRDAATEEIVRHDDPRIRVMKVAGVSYRLDAVQDDAFAPGKRLALVPEPDNEHDPNADRRLGRGAAGCRPATFPAEIARGSTPAWQAVSLLEFFDGGRRVGLRVLLAPRDAWIGVPRT